jgi:ribosomal protein S12 methylthiotransferase
VTHVAVVTLGCPKNAIDSEGLGGLLAAAGHVVGDSVEDAEVVLVNTCGFIDPARRETVQEVLELAELKESGALRGLVLTGCLVARSASDLHKALPEVDALVDFAAYARIGAIVEKVARGTLEDVVQGHPGTRFDPAWWDATLAAGPRLRFGRAPWAYLKIAEGCDRGCTFCAIPLMRGKFRSRHPDVIENEARHLVSQGVTELSLVSQDSVMWGRDNGAGDLVSLLRRLESIEGLRRLRLMYLHPRGVTDELIEVMSSSDVVASYFDLSLQHVSQAVLKRMGRWGGRARFERMIDKVRSSDDSAAIRSTFILGFPGETDSHVDELVDFVACNDFDWIGVFGYSREEGTRSHDMSGQVPDALIRERTDRIAHAAELTMERRARKLIGHELQVLAERLDVARELWIGRSAREAPEVDGEIVFASSAPLSVGDYVPVMITGSEGADLVGQRRGASG